MPNVGGFFKAASAVVSLVDAAQRLRGGAQPDDAEPKLTPRAASSLEAKLTNVVVAALGEAFDRDRARLDLERTQLDEQRRRAEEALKLELRRQRADREVARLRLLAGTALVGWIASVAMLAVRLPDVADIARGLIAASWLLLLGSLGAAFQGQKLVDTAALDASAGDGSPLVASAALWLLVAGLGVAAMSLLF